MAPRVESLLHVDDGRGAHFGHGGRLPDARAQQLGAHQPREEHSVGGRPHGRERASQPLALDVGEVSLAELDVQVACRVDEVGLLLQQLVLDAARETPRHDQLLLARPRRLLDRARDEPEHVARRRPDLPYDAGSFAALGHFRHEREDRERRPRPLLNLFSGFPCCHFMFSDR